MSTSTDLVSHWINGADYLGSGEHTAPLYDPALGTVSRQVALANAEDVDAAVAGAAAAFPVWRNTSVTRRQQIMFRFRELLNERKDELAEILTSEHGKVLSDAVGEITRPRGRRARCQISAPRQGRVLRAGVDGRRRVLHEAAARCGALPLVQEFPSFTHLNQP